MPAARAASAAETGAMLCLLILMHGQGAEGAEVRRAYQRGDLLRLRRGCYIDAKTWYGYTAWNRYDTFAEAVGVTQRAPVLIQETAARIWGLPLRKVPRDIQVRAPRHSLLRRCAARMLRHEQAPNVSDERFQPRGFGVRHRYVPEPEVVRCSSVVVSSLRDTAVQCAAYLAWEDAVMVVDAAVAGRSWQRTFLEELVARVDEVVEPRKRRRARAVLAFASTAAETAGESFSRVVIDQLGFEPPQLQVEIFDDEGLAGRVDLAWRVKGRLSAGEFDGAVKYGRGADVHGRCWNTRAFRRCTDQPPKPLNCLKAPPV